MHENHHGAYLQNKVIDMMLAIIDLFSRSQISSNHLSIRFYPVFHHLLPPLTASFELNPYKALTCAYFYSNRLHHIK